MWFRFISLSLTALTLCAFYSADAKWVLNEDWSALMDVVPTLSKTLWAIVFLYLKKAIDNVVELSGY